MKFLVVDDEPEILLLVRANVRAWGHECLVADTAAEAHRLCSEMAPDVLLLDLAMPDVDGRELLGQLRRADSAPPHVVLLSAISPEELERVGVELGVSWLSKPFTAEAFRTLIGQTIEGVLQ